jgi:ubiquinone/menaquinone biosynthesis C-methylase UbiE
VTEQEQTAFEDNAEAIEAWDGPLFERFVQYRHIVVTGLTAHGDEALRLHPPVVGDRVLDVGCGFGDASQQIAALVGPEGTVLGVDASPRFVEAATEEAAGVENVEFAVADVEHTIFDGPFDYAFSRFGTMFFANPVAALRHVREGLRPGGKLVMVVWRAKVENDWVYRAQQIVERFVAKPEQYDDPTCGPGPFSMGNADTTSGILLSAGFEQISLHRCDLPIRIGADVEEAAEYVMSIGPAGEIIRLQGDRAAHLHEPIAEALREGLSEWDGPDGVVAPASTWIVSAVVPS